jgi:hypothetical protein
LTTVALRIQPIYSITQTLYPFNPLLSTTAFMMARVPVQTLRQTARASTQHVYGPPHFGARIATHPLSTQSAPRCNDRVQQTVDQLCTSQTFHPRSDASTSPGRPVADPKTTRTEQLVWLAQQSLAASTARKSDVTSATASERAVMSHEKQGSASPSRSSHPQAWDGPTVWAHLW